MTSCRVGALAEPLAGTAPQARMWWLIEVPGAWGRQAVAECRWPEVAALTSNDDRRVLLVRRPGRHPAAPDQDVLRVWIVGGVGGSVRALVVPRSVLPSLGADADDRGWDVDVADDAPRLVVCANAARDACCGVDGRALLRGLGDLPGVWECSHLGGHRFAPTALHVRQGMVYGRLTHEAARDITRFDVVDARWCSLMRGSPAVAPALQAVQIAVLRSEGHLPSSLSEEPDGSVRFEAAGVARSARAEYAEVGSWPVSCGGPPETAGAWRVALSSG